MKNKLLAIVASLSFSSCAVSYFPEVDYNPPTSKIQNKDFEPIGIVVAQKKF